MYESWEHLHDKKMNKIQHTILWQVSSVIKMENIYKRCANFIRDKNKNQSNGMKIVQNNSVKENHNRIKNATQHIILYQAASNRRTNFIQTCAEKPSYYI